MDFIQTLFDLLATAVRAVWPGVVGAAAAGYLGWTLLGFTGFLVGSAGGAVAGTWAAIRLGIFKRNATGADWLLYAGLAFGIVFIGFYLLQFALIIGAILALVAIAAAWLTS